MNKGVVYKVSGDPYVQEAKKSASSIRSHNEDIKITLISDKDIQHHAIDNVVPLSHDVDGMGDSLLRPSDIQYERTLFLDSDTYICGDITGIFELLDRSDVVLAFSPNRTSDLSREQYDSMTTDEVLQYTEIPDVFPNYNSGVIALHDSEPVHEMLNRWDELYQQWNIKYNQPSLRRALYESDLDISVLPPEYNFRVPYIGVAHGPVKIVHGRPSKSFEYVEKFRDEVNSSEYLRVTTFGKWPIRISTNMDSSLRFTLADKYHEAKYKRRRFGNKELSIRTVRFFGRQLRDLFNL